MRPSPRTHYNTYAFDVDNAAFAGPGVGPQAPLWTLAHAEMRKLAAKRPADEDRAALRGVPIAPLPVLPSAREDTAAPNANQSQAQFPFPSQGLGQAGGYGFDARRVDAHAVLADLALCPGPSTASHSRATATPDSYGSGSTSGSGWPPPRGMSPASHTSASEPPSVLFERAPRRKDTFDSASVYSTDSAATSEDVHRRNGSKYQICLDQASASQLVLPADVGLDDVPLVDVAFDLAALASVPDPSAFFEERDVMSK